MSHRWATVAVLALVSALILGSVVALPSNSAARTPSAVRDHDGGPTIAVHPRVFSAHGTAAIGSSTTSTALVNAAVASLRQGGGPAHGVPAPCTVTAGGQATCDGSRPATGASPGSPAPSTPHGAPPAASPTWYNVTANLSKASGGVTPTVGFGGRMAYDPLLNEVVLFNGCSTTCPTNQTWTYNGNSWTDLTGTLSAAPSPRQGAGMAYDPSFKGVILFGGTNAADVNLNDTWLFNSTGWSNITATVGLPTDVFGDPVNWAWGAMAWDPALDTIVAVDGCVDSGCTDIWGQTWFLNVTGWSAAWGPNVVDVENPTYLAYNSLAYDEADGYLVSYGGYDAYEYSSSNDTFTMNATGVWVNITAKDAGCVGTTCYTPPGRDSDAITWDSQLNAIFMTAGYNVSTGVWLNDSWTFSGGVWYPANLTAANPPAGYCPVAQPTLAGMSDNVAPFILGGYGPNCPGNEETTNEWVYEVAPHPTLSASPVHVDLGTATELTASWTLGTGSGIVATWNISLGDGHSHPIARGSVANTSTAFSTGVSYTYGAAGTYSTAVNWTDFFYISGHAAGPTVTVNPALVATITASARNITAGGSVTFSTDPTGGSGTYTYQWTFGDGTNSTAEGPPAHTYSKAGTYVVNLTVTDSLGTSVKDSVTITVKAPPSSGLSLGTTGTYVIVGVVVVVVAALAALLLARRRKKPASAPAAWQPSAAPPPGGSAPPPGAMGGGAPPGAGEMPPPPPPS